EVARHLARNTTPPADNVNIRAPCLPRGVPPAPKTRRSGSLSQASTSSALRQADSTAASRHNRVGGDSGAAGAGARVPQATVDATVRPSAASDTGRTVATAATVTRPKAGAITQAPRWGPRCFGISALASWSGL